MAPGRTPSWALPALLAWGLLLGLWGLPWGLPGAERLDALPESMRGPAAAKRLAEGWGKLYEGIEETHKALGPEEPVTYARGAEVIEPGWTWPPPKLENSYRSLLLRSENPDEQKPFVVLSRMRPWRLEFKPLYVHYGGAFIYPLGAFLGTASLFHIVTLTPDLTQYLLNPQDMGRLYLLGRLFVLLFHLGSLWLLFELGRRLADWKAGLLAGVFFTLAPAACIYSHNLKPHPYSAFWCLAAALAAVAAVESGKRRAYLASGLCAGLAAGANFSFACFAVFPLAAWALRRKRGEAASAAGAAALAAGVFLATNPYLLAAPRDFLWELTVYPQKGAFALGGLWLVLGQAFGGALGPVLAGLAGAGFARGLASKEPRGRLLSAAGLLCFLALWISLTRLWGFMTGASAARFFYPLLAFCALWAALFARGLRKPAWLGPLLIAAALADGLPRAWLHLENMRRDAGPSGTRRLAAQWIEDHVPAGATVGLPRYPQPAHSAPFRYDHYRLVVFDRAEALAGKPLPEWLVLGEAPDPALHNLLEKDYNQAADFEPIAAGWARVLDDSFFANAGMSIHHRR